jgi:Domain of unknown function (DUF4249)
MVTPSANVVVVHAVLNAAVRDQYVIVQTTDGGLAPPVTGATVIVATPDGRALVADEVRDSANVIVSGYPMYRISLDRYGLTLVPGATYRLDITLPDGRKVSGSTTMPASTPRAVLGLPPSFSRATDTLALAWSPVAGAAAYEVSISSEWASFNAFADTALVLKGDVRNSGGSAIFVSGVVSQIVVSAVDANYYDYYRRASDPLTGSGPIMRLTGAVGVFGSIVPIASGTLSVR